MSCKSGLVIEIRERYEEVVGDRWPVAVGPQTDELLSSWLHLLAIENGVAPRVFADVLGLGDGMWLARLAACRTELSAIEFQWRFSSWRLGLIAI